MSNIGKRLIQIPKNITLKVELKDNLTKTDKLTITGPLGSAELNIPTELKLDILTDSIQNSQNLLILPFESNLKNNSSKIWGTFRSLVFNTIIGLSQGFQVNLKIVGVGYRASIEKTSETSKKLILKLGFSHLVTLDIPDNITISCPKPTQLILRSNNLNELMQYAALIKSYKEPEPYKGKGILYKGEKIRRKEGKKK